MPLGKEEVETCWAVPTPILYTVEAFGLVKSKAPAAENGRNELLMMSEIYQRGPIVCSIATPDDFTYKCVIWPIQEIPLPSF